MDFSLCIIILIAIISIIFLSVRHEGEKDRRSLDYADKTQISVDLGGAIFMGLIFGIPILMFLITCSR